MPLRLLAWSLPEAEIMGSWLIFVLEKLKGGTSFVHVSLLLLLEAVAFKLLQKGQPCPTSLVLSWCSHPLPCQFLCPLKCSPIKVGLGRSPSCHTNWQQRSWHSAHNLPWHSALNPLCLSENTTAWELEPENRRWPARQAQTGKHWSSHTWHHCAPFQQLTSWTALGMQKEQCQLHLARHASPF